MSETPGGRPADRPPPEPPPNIGWPDLPGWTARPDPPPPRPEDRRDDESAGAQQGQPGQPRTPPTPAATPGTGPGHTPKVPATMAPDGRSSDGRPPTAGHPSKPAG